MFRIQTPYNLQKKERFLKLIFICIEISSKKGLYYHSFQGIKLAVIHELPVLHEFKKKEKAIKRMTFKIIIYHKLTDGIKPIFQIFYDVR